MGTRFSRFLLEWHAVARSPIAQCRRPLASYLLVFVQIHLLGIAVLHWHGLEIREATFEASMVRSRPIMMTALVACLGLLPAALSHGIGSDSQRPFAIVIVAGLISRLFLGRIVSPVLYQMVAREGDVLQV